MSDGKPVVQVLVVEDDDGNRLLLTRFLAQEGYIVESVADGPAAVQAVTNNPPDIVVLDLGLPGMDGIAVLRRIRHDSGVPVLVLTGRDDEPAKLAAFDVGADDYVAKPFSLPEIGARLRALARRGSALPRCELFEFDRLMIDTGALIATLDGEPLDLRPKEFSLLAFLASAPGRCFSREELLEHVWGSTEGWQQAATVTEHVHRLRTRLAVGERPHEWIATVRGAGYRFVVPDATGSTLP
jgi:two-component system, OmpR family, phosphate regulon response regulator PhoB